MDTLTIVSDTLAVKFRTATNVCQTCVEETGTNGYDVLIVFIIPAWFDLMVIAALVKLIIIGVVWFHPPFDLKPAVAILLN